MYTYSIITLKIARKINRNVDFPGFSKSFIRLSANPHRKLRLKSTFLESGILTVQRRELIIEEVHINI